METVGRLAGGVAHDFNNVLAVIAGYAEQAGGSHELNRLHESVHGIAAAARRGAAISRKLLSFSRRESIRPEVFEIGAALRDITPMLRQLFGDGHAVTLHGEPDTSRYVRMDRGQLELSLLNIAANARDAMPVHGRFSITWQAWRHGSDEGVAIDLRDDGEGMDDDVRQRIFEPYFTTKAAGAGTGLGLAVVRDALHEGGGWIEVESAPRKGARFRLWLPGVARPDTDDTALPAVRVLLVEDDSELRELLLEAFDDAGCVAIATDNAADAMRLLGDAGDSLQVVVSDCHLPGSEDGRLAWLDAVDLPMVLISPGVDAEAQRLREAGRDVVCLPKPFPPAALVERVRKMVSSRQASIT
jgi:CheY-like chemotaxis protein